MHIDMSLPIVDLITGKQMYGQREIGHPPEREFYPYTLGRMCIEALLGFNPKETPDGAEKLRRFLLAERIHQEPKPDLTTDEIVLCKTLIGTGFQTLAAGQALLMLEPRTDPMTGEQLAR